MKKFLSLALVALMALTLLAGCTNNGGGASSTAPAPSTPAESAPSEAAGGTEGKISFSVWDLDTTPWLEPLAQAFMDANPGTEVEFINTPSAEYTDKLSVMLNGGTDFDVFMIKDADTTLNFAKKGQLEVLDDRIAADGIDMSAFNGLDGYFMFDGMQQAMPIRTDYYVLYYNKDIFDAANEPYPSNDMTWAEFEEIAGRITAGTGTDKKYGAHLHTWQACVENWAVQDGANTIMSAAPDYSYEFMRDAYEMALRMQEAGYIQDYSTLKTGNIHYNSAFSTGQVGMMPMGSWFAANMIGFVSNGESDVNWGIAKLPHPEGLAAGNTVGSTTPIAINPNSKNKDLAWEFIKFATGDEGAAVLASYGQFPARTNDTLLDTITSVEGMPEGAKEALSIENIVLDRPIVEKVSEVNKMLEEEHGLVMGGSQDLDTTLANMAERSKGIQEE